MPQGKQAKVKRAAKREAERKQQHVTRNPNDRQAQKPPARKTK